MNRNSFDEAAELQEKKEEQILDLGTVSYTLLGRIYLL
jgi:hypothetical protein